jgi:predicted nucleotidyltransferase
MKDDHGLSGKTVEAIHHVLARFPDVERAVLFGSRAKGNFKPGSDIDLALSGPKLKQEMVNRIDEELDELPLPYRFSLALYHEITDAEVLAHIGRVGIVFYERASTSAKP